MRLSLRTHRLDSLGEAPSPIDAGDEDILHTTLLEFDPDLQPELGAFGLTDPEPQKFLRARYIAFTRTAPAFRTLVWMQSR